MEPLWLYRSLLNADDIIRWAYDNGAKKIIIPEQLHATIAVVREPCQWPEVLDDNTLVYENGKMEIFGFMVKALAFDAPEIRARRLMLEGAYPDMDHAGKFFRPHITMYRGGKLLKTPYEGRIVLGPEIAAEFSEEKGRNVEHIKIASLMSSP